LKKENSDFVKFLRNVALDEKNGKYNVLKLKILGLLLCEGSHNEKVEEFYDVL